MGVGGSGSRYVPQPALLPAAPIGLQWQTAANGSRDWLNLRTQQNSIFKHSYLCPVRNAVILKASTIEDVIYETVLQEWQKQQQKGLDLTFHRRAHQSQALPEITMFSSWFSGNLMRQPFAFTNMQVDTSRFCSSCLKTEEEEKGKGQGLGLELGGVLRDLEDLKIGVRTGRLPSPQHLRTEGAQPQVPVQNVVPGVLQPPICHWGRGLDPPFSSTLECRCRRRSWRRRCEFTDTLAVAIATICSGDVVQLDVLHFR
ncbi:hypothetical protein UY3_10693 [Chelonia mydas]|uniref:Uncharacterized protein n=1 Tax=Chelonia mydas TaxID=8469 RepID=M7B2P2_CHEMY|nr:hypothetical protein UY3_10693 [Chelonia mydas]